ncbi:vps35 [Candida pseudojiufengensis]|uniref:vps35 n=1 Tax=Candida pseudojiufengensis TaxID=497109 RepID=UPI0022240554|nr:vps35 [Candida pseudojiufengensis]KAI5964666.1 vps35 [Candida pseudojiufengensis]
MAISSSEQTNILNTSISNIKHQSNLMKNDLEENKLLQALKHCSNFLNELRTNQLTPKQYYEIYMLIFDSLEILSLYLSNNNTTTTNDSTQNTFLADLYEIVQYSGNIIPRLYMMIVIGTTYMKFNNSPIKDLMKDMIEMCHGVQHPIRGLFLRYYLSQRIKNLLPFDNKQDFNETIEFLIKNFIEMNKLWVRLQHQGHSSEREIRYKERKELKILVGSNLVRLSQIMDDYESLNNEKRKEDNEKDNADIDDSFSQIEFYKDKVFPIITEQIIQCKDHLAQTYLIDVIIQIFPDEFHFATLEDLLNQVFLNLHPLLNKSELVNTLIEKFITYNKFNNDMENLSINGNTSPQKRLDVNKLFEIFWKFYLNLIKNEESNISIEENSKLLKSFINLSLTFDDKNFKNLDIIYEFAAENLTTPQNDKIEEEEQQELLLSLLMESIKKFTSIKTIFIFNNFFPFYEKLNKSLQKEISISIVDKILELFNGEEFFSDVNEIDNIFKYLLILVKDSPSTDLDTAKDLGITKTIKINNGEKLITPEYLEIQSKLSLIIQLINDPNDLNKSINNLFYIRKKYLNKNHENIIYTYPTLISQILFKLKIIGYINLNIENKELQENNQSKLISNFKNLSIIIDELYQIHYEYNSELILSLYLNIASISDQLKLNSITFEIFNQIFIIYEENLIMSMHQYKPYLKLNPYNSLASGSIAYQSIISIANTLIKIRFLSKNQYNELITKLTLYGSKILKKQDQCRAIYSCAHLWWWSENLLLPNEKSPIVEDDDVVDGDDKIKENEEENASKDKSTQEDTKETNDKTKEESKENPQTELIEIKPQLYRDSKRVLECLQKSLRISDSSIDPYLSLHLFIEILNKCLVFNIYGNQLINLNYINGLINLIKTNIENLNDSNNNNEEKDEENDDNKESKIFKSTISFFNQTLQQINHHFSTNN